MPPKFYPDTPQWVIDSPAKMAERREKAKSRMLELFPPMLDVIKEALDADDSEGIEPLTPVQVACMRNIYVHARKALHESQ